MRLRTRLGLWFGGVLVASLALMAFSLHREIGAIRLAVAHGVEPSTWFEAEEIVVGYALPLAALMFPIGWFLVRRAMDPVVGLTEAARRIHANNLREPIRRSGNGDELDRLAAVFNEMLSRLDDSFVRVREFTLHASHELKTPLTVMRIQVESAMRDPATPAATRDMLHSKLEEIRRLAGIVDSLAILAKADAGLPSGEFAETDFSELLADSVEDAKILGESRGVTFALEADSGVILQANANRLRQLLINLFDNASKYNRPDGTVAVRLRRLGDMAELAVENTGPGIPAEELPRVFERFRRGPGVSAKYPDGCGLGLSLCEWIVRLHGGAIRAESVPGKTTTFTVTLPLGK